MSTFDDTTRAEVDELATCLESAGYTDDAARIRAALAEIDRCGQEIERLRELVTPPVCRRPPAAGRCSEQMILAHMCEQCGYYEDVTP